MPETGILNAVVIGITTGSILALGAIGVSLIYRIADVPNFAHGELFTWGAYLVLFVNAANEVPLLDLLVGNDGEPSIALYVVLFAITAGSTLLTIYLVGGRRALRGSLWPWAVSPTTGAGLNLFVAVFLGAIVVIGAPSVWIGFVIAAPVIAVMGMVQERFVYRYFRARGAELGILLIVALGVSLFMRNGVIATFGGSSLNFRIPQTYTVFGYELYYAAVQRFDFYLTGAGLTIQVTDSGPQVEPVLATVGYSWTAIVAAFAGSAVAAGAVNYWRRTADRTPGLGAREVAVALGVFAIAIVALANGRTVPATTIAETRINLSPLRGSVIAFTAVSIWVLHVLLQRTKLGTAMRASSDNIELAKVTGINTDQVMMATWIIAGVFAAAGGLMLGLLFHRLVPSMGFFLLLPMFAAVILGGGGTVSGAIVGGYLVGLAEEVGLFVIPGAEPAHRVPLAFALLLVVLLVKPEGITGGR